MKKIEITAHSEKGIYIQRRGNSLLRPKKKEEQERRNNPSQNKKKEQERSQQKKLKKEAQHKNQITASDEKFIQRKGKRQLIHKFYSKKAKDRSASSRN